MHRAAHDANLYSEVGTMSCTYKYTAALALPLAALLAACASPSPQDGFAAAAQASAQRSGAGAPTRVLRNDDDARALSSMIDKMLAQPLSADAAVQVALLNNRGLQASYWSLGIAQADLAQAGRLQNPSFDFQRVHGGGEVGIERTLTFNLVNLITLPLAARLEAQRYEQTKLQVSNVALMVAADTRRAYYEAVAAAQGVGYAKDVSASAQASAELAERMRKAGNWSQLDLAREQAYFAQAVADASHAGRSAVAAREKLTRLMGLNGAQINYALPDRLPELPPSLIELKEVEERALRERLDIQAATLDTQQTASALGLTKTTRFINVLDLGAVNADAGEPHVRGYQLTLEIPLFDWGTARVARAEAVYMQSASRLAEAATNARSEARVSYADYRASYDLARHYRDEVLPLRKQISDETLLRYNGMLLSAFELLADAREQAGAVNGYIVALKEYWIAQTNLEAALGGRLSDGAASTEKTGAQP